MTPLTPEAIREALEDITELDPVFFVGKHEDTILYALRVCEALNAEPSEAMQIAALNSWHGQGKLYMAVWKAMIAALLKDVEGK